MQSASMDLPQFFTELAIKAKNRRAKFKGGDFRFVYVSLLYLRSQADLPAMKRDSDIRKDLWREIWPHLKEAGIMHDYKESFILKARLEIFLRR